MYASSLRTLIDFATVKYGQMPQHLYERYEKVAYTYN